MNVVDIILIVPLLYALWVGYRDGVVVQLGGIVGVLIGVFLAYKFCEPFGKWLDLPASISSELAFVIIVLAAFLAIGILSKVLGRIVDSVGLGMFNKTGGVVLSVVKMATILSVLILGFEALNNTTKWVKQPTLQQSKLYKPLESVSGYVFPYLTTMKDKIKKHIE